MAGGESRAFIQPDRPAPERGGARFFEQRVDGNAATAVGDSRAQMPTPVVATARVTLSRRGALFGPFPDLTIAIRIAEIPSWPRWTEDDSTRLGDVYHRPRALACQELQAARVFLRPFDAEEALLPIGFLGNLGVPIRGLGGREDGRRSSAPGCFPLSPFSIQSADEIRPWGQYQFRKTAHGKHVLGWEMLGVGMI